MRPVSNVGATYEGTHLTHIFLDQGTKYFPETEPLISNSASVHCNGGMTKKRSGPPIDKKPKLQISAEDTINKICGVPNGMVRSHLVQRKEKCALNSGLLQRPLLC